MNTDETRAIEITGGSAETLAEALDQWEAERQALAELWDEHQALELSFRRYDVTMGLAAGLIDALEVDAQMFISQKTRDKIAQFREQMQKLEEHRANSRIIIAEARERRVQKGEPNVEAT